MRYAESLMQLGDAKRAHEILLDLFNVVPPTPEQARLTALAANAAGDVADSYYYMSEYHLMSGDLPLAINQLQLALAVPKITDVQRARFEARLEEVQQALPKRGARRAGADRRRQSPSAELIQCRAAARHAALTDSFEDARRMLSPLRAARCGH